MPLSPGLEKGPDCGPQSGLRLADNSLTRERDRRMKILAARWILPIVSDPISPGWVVIEAGRIAAWGGGRPPGPVTHDYGMAALIPGFVNAHAHLGCSFLKASVPDLPFFEWLTAGIAPRVIDAVQNHQDLIVRCAEAAADELLTGGVVTVGDSFLHDAGRQVLRRRGMRGVFYREWFGSLAADLDAYVETIDAATRDDLEREGRTAGPATGVEVGYGVAPHAPYTCPHVVMERLGQVARERNLPVTMHVAESREEVAMFKDRSGPMYDLFAGGGRERNYRLGCTPLEAVAAAGLLGNKTTIVHGCGLTASDIAKIAESGASLVHCPSSNLRLAVPIARIADCLAAGVNVALGTDSAASNGKLDMFEEMRLAILSHRALTAGTVGLDIKTVLAMATINGAKALGLDACTGSVAVGKWADLCVVRLDRPRHSPGDDPLHAVVWSSTPDDVVATWIGGALVHERPTS